MKRITDALEVSRSNVYKHGAHPRIHYRKKEDPTLAGLIREITDARPTYGYRRICALLNRRLRETGKSGVNHKRVYRIMHVNHLLLQRHTGRPVRVHDGTIITKQSNQRWCSDMFEILCDNGERVRVVFCLDCADREILGYFATTGGVTGEMICDLMATAIENRFGIVDRVPEGLQWLSDNGPAYTAWETRSFARQMGFDIRTTPYYSPESNGMAESFIKTFKRDYVSMHDIPDARGVMEQLTGWFEDYNEYHPHIGLKRRSPREHRRLMAKLEKCPV